MLMQHGKGVCPGRAGAVYAHDGLLFFKKGPRPRDVCNKIPEDTEIRIDCYIPLREEDAPDCNL